MRNNEISKINTLIGQLIALGCHYLKPLDFSQEEPKILEKLIINDSLETAKKPEQTKYENGRNNKNGGNSR